MANMDNVALVQRMYETLIADDIPGFLELVSPDAEWQYPAEGALPYGGTWRGHAGIVRFLEMHDSAEEVLDLQVSDIVAQDDRVVVLGTFRGRSVKTGRVWETRFAHALIVRGGEIQRFEAYFDTLAGLSAHGQ